MSLRTELQGIYDDKGRLTPVLVVEAARAEGHPLHDRFEWREDVAAELWRREQASELIRSVRMIVRRPDSEQRIEVRSWHSIAGPEGYGYEPNEKVIADPLLRQLVLRDMEREWKQLKARYSDFVEFYEVVRADLVATG